MTSADRLDLLVDEAGYFHHSFFSLWALHRFAPPQTRRRLEQQVRVELEAQIEKPKAEVGANFLVALDSHRHLHLIPFIFEAVVEAALDWQSPRVRITREPFLLGTGSLMATSPLSYVKRLLLGTLSKGHRAVLDRHDIAYPDYFVGLQYTGRMSPAVVDAALRRIRLDRVARSVEILFHPGQAVRGEEPIWSRYPAFRKYYFSEWRKFESDGVRGADLKACLERHASPNQEQKNA